MYHSLLKSSLVLTAVFISSLSSAQSKREILQEDPKQIPNLRLDITPLSVSSGNYSHSATWGVKGSYRHKNKFSVSGEYRQELYENDEIFLEGSGYYYGKNFKGSAMEFIGTYYFFSHEKESEEWLAVKRTAIGRNTVQVTVDPLMVTKLYLFGARAGYLNYEFTDEIGNLTVYEKANPSNIRTEQYGVARHKSGVAFVGVSASRLKNIKVSYPGYGVRRKQNFREFYADVMYAASNSFSDLMHEGSLYSIDKTSPLKKTGFRVGYVGTPTGKMINFGAGAEAGVYPGQHLQSEFYLNVKFIFSFGTRVGLREKE
jgi:hypothetical protein